MGSRAKRELYEMCFTMSWRRLCQLACMEESATIDRMENGFAKDLARFGPQCLTRPVSLAAARAYCTRLARSHYENFTVASFFSPRRLLQPFPLSVRVLPLGR